LAILIVELAHSKKQTRKISEKKEKNYKKKGNKKRSPTMRNKKKNSGKTIFYSGFPPLNKKQIPFSMCYYYDPL